MKNVKKIIIAVLAVVVVLACMVGVISAYLTKKTQTIVNTFTYGNVNITLTEEGAVENEQSFKMIPGQTITKNADVTVKAGSEACYVYIEVVVANNTSSEEQQFISFAMDAAWTQLGETNIYYTDIINLVDVQEDTVLSVFNADTITVNGDITAEELAAIVNQPTISLTAYAVQSAGFDDAADAWANTFGAPIETESETEPAVEP